MTPDPNPRAQAARQSTQSELAAARALLEIDAVLVRPQEPFTHTSGRLAPVYVDCRRLIAFPAARNAVMELAQAQLSGLVGEIDLIAGGETAGIPFAAFLAERLGLPMAYVRKQPKGFGRLARIEGALEPGQRVLLVEDLASDAGSKRLFVGALREAGASVAHIWVLFFYGIYPIADARFRELEVTLHALTRWEAVYEVLAQEQRLDADSLRRLRAYLDAPENWTP